MDTATIKLFLVLGDAKRLRTAEISNWTGKALAAPRSDLDQLAVRPEAAKSGVYILTGNEPDTGKPVVYIGEGEQIRDRLKAHTAKDYWGQVILFVSKDENLTKAHIRYLEGRLIEEAQSIGRYSLVNSVASGAKLPEPDTADMEVFLSRIRQLLPVLGSELLTPIAVRRPTKEAAPGDEPLLYHSIKGLQAKGMRTPSGFVVFEGSQAVAQERKSALQQHPFVVELRGRLVQEGALVVDRDHLRFSRDVEFTSPSTAAAVCQGGGANGLTAWRDDSGRTLKDFESSQGLTSP